MSYLNGKSFNPAMNRRTLIAGVAGLGSTAILAGCSNGGSSDAAGSSAASGTFKLGVIGPQTGDTASYGVSVANGAKLGAKDFSGDTYTFSAEVQDSVGDAEKAVTAFNTLVDNGIQALVGPTLTGESVAVAPEAEDAEVFMITPSASSTDVTKDHKGVYQACFTDPNQGVNAAKYAANKMPNEKVAVLFQSDDAYSQTIAENFQKQGKQLKLDIVEGDYSFTKDTATDFKNQLTTAQNAGATVVFAPIYYTPASILLKQANDMGYKFTLFGCDGMDGLLGVEGFDTSLAEGVLLMTPFAADDPKNKDFVDAYKKAYGETPDQFAADAYDCVHAIAEGLKAAGTAADADAATVRDDLIDAFGDLKVEGLTGTLTWNDKGEVQKDPTAYKIQDGKYVTA